MLLAAGLAVEGVAGGDADAANKALDELQDVERAFQACPWWREGAKQLAGSALQAHRRALVEAERHSGSEEVRARAKKDSGVLLTRWFLIWKLTAFNQRLLRDQLCRRARFLRHQFLLMDVFDEWLDLLYTLQAARVLLAVLRHRH